MGLPVGQPGTIRDEKSHCPFVPGQEQQQKSWEKLLCLGTSRDKKNVKKVKLSKKDNFIYFFFTLFSFLSRCCPGIFQDGTGQAVKTSSPPVAKYQNPVPDLDWLSRPVRSLCPGTTKELLSLCLKKLHCPVQLETPG